MCSVLLWCAACWLVLVVFLLLSVTAAMLCSSNSLVSASFPQRAPVAVTRRLRVLVRTHSAISASLVLLSVLLLLPVLKESSVCQGVQRCLFVRLVLAWGLKLAIALLRA